jgi:hypothetical protein
MRRDQAAQLAVNTLIKLANISLRKAPLEYLLWPA